MTDASVSPWLTDEQQRVWRQWLDVAARLPAALGRQLQQGSALSLPDFAVLVSLSEAPGEQLRVAALADDLRWEPSRLSHHLGRMERRGLIRRAECLEDGRGAVVVLLPAGRAGVEEAAPGHARLVSALLFDGFGEDRLRALDTITRSVLDRLERHDATDR
ncbi:MAG: MarR family transcriptional regulator [Dermatophilaceae bacterium]